MSSAGSLCPRFHLAVELIGSRWTGAIIHRLLAGRARYNELRATIPDISDRMLSERLRELEAEGAASCSLDQPASTDDGGATLAETVADDRFASIDELLTHEQEVTQLKHAITCLKEQERNVLALSFFEELKLHEIAEVLDLSVCRISQIRTAALAKLRVRLTALRAA